MIKTRFSLIAACILICLSLLTSCSLIKRSSSITILFVEDQEISVLNSVEAETAQGSKNIRAGLLIYNTGFRTASFIPLFFSSNFSYATILESVTEWFDVNLTLKIDYSALLAGSTGINLYEVLDSLAEPVQRVNQGNNKLDDKDLDRWSSVINNADLFLQDEVFKHILSAIGNSIPEKIIRKFIEMYTEDEAEFYYMRRLVIDINSVNGYLYEREYIRQVYTAQQESVK